MTATAVAEPEPEFVPGTYVVTFDRILSANPAPLVATVRDESSMAEQIITYAMARTGGGLGGAGFTVAIDPMLPGRSVGSGWISTGGRDAGRFTWKARPES